MNAITHAVMTIKHTIPDQILRLAFPANKHNTLDDAIVNSVIRARVIPDMDLVGGVQEIIPLKGCEILYSDPIRFTFFVPKTLTKGLSIVSVDTIVTNGDDTDSSIFGNPYRLATNDLEGSIDQLSSQRITYGTVTNRVELSGENTIICHDPISHLKGLCLHCNIGNDKKTLTNLDNRTIPAFSQMAVLAAKGLIWTRCVLMVNEGYVKNGHEMTNIRSIIESDYANANAEYDEYRDDKWAKVSWTSDTNAYSDLISLAC